MHWNYRIIRHRESNNNIFYGLHEVYYKNNKPWAHTSRAIFIGDSPEEIKEVIEMVKKDIERLTVLDENEIYENKNVVKDLEIEE